MRPHSVAATSSNLLDELQTALSHGTVARRVETLRQVTDLFVNAINDYSEEHIDLFDDVFACLIRHIESSARALLATRLAPIPRAPRVTIETLAFDDLIDVAAPVLSQSERLDDEVLVRNARTKSQAHLLAISARKVLSGAVTEVLVERGNEEVVHSTVRNPGAEISERGFDTLIARAEQDDNIATCVALRPSIPRHQYLKLIARASASVRARLEAANPEASADVLSAVGEAAQRARTASAAVSEETTIAHGLVRSLYEDGRLDEHQVAAFAEGNRFDETNAALACLAHVPVSVAETMMVESPTEGLLILAKVSGISWTTVRAVIRMRTTLQGLEPEDIETCRTTYERLRPSTAQQVLRFHRMQQQSAATSAAA